MWLIYLKFQGFGSNCGVSLSCSTKAWACCCSRVPSDFLKSDIRALVQLGEGAGARPCYRMWELTLEGRLLGFNG